MDTFVTYGQNPTVGVDTHYVSSCVVTNSGVV